MMMKLRKFRCDVCYDETGPGCVLVAYSSVIPRDCPYSSWGFNDELEADWEEVEDDDA